MSATRLLIGQLEMSRQSWYVPSTSSGLSIGASMWSKKYAPSMDVLGQYIMRCGW